MSENSSYRAVIVAAEEYLRQKNKVGPSDTASSKEVVEHVRRQMSSGELDFDLTSGTIINYISRAANNDPDSAIFSGGSGRGYWLDVTAKEATGQKKVEVAKLNSGRGGHVSFSEKQLYPLVEFWLSSKGYVSRDVSSLKSGGKWGNPDIVGLNRVEMLGSIEIETVQCEVKITDSNWEQYIFEAISHKRASNRSWFCYRVAERDAPLPKGMEYYAEKYRVGIVQIVLTDAQMIKLKGSDVQHLDFIENVLERVPAIYDFVPLQEKKELIERANIKIAVSF